MNLFEMFSFWISGTVYYGLNHDSVNSLISFQSYLTSKNSVERWRCFQRRPNLDIIVYPWRSQNWNGAEDEQGGLTHIVVSSELQSEGGPRLTGVEGVWLQAVDHVVVGFEQHEVLRGVSVPDEDVAAVWAAHHKIVAPETRLLYLKMRGKMREKKNTMNASSAAC